ncbi:hypothetical protein AX16_008703 [Volvariella volvacea WC 439]|nr:hypothetical protein AX16_008703 [Volvariella volvacea WC 439]
MPFHNFNLNLSVVIMWALRQRIMAAVLAEKYRNFGWTTTHDFFVQMGGLMLEVEKGKYEVVTVDGSDELVTSSGVTPNILHAIRKKEINDHRKGDVLAKAIVVLQTSWFVVQCIARHAEGLVVTEIELVTLAFAALNAVTYMFWLDKPLNVGYISIERGFGWMDQRKKRKSHDVQVTEAENAEDQTTETQKERANEDHPTRKEQIKAIWRKGVMTPFELAFGPLLELTNTELDPLTSRPTSVQPFFAAVLRYRQHHFAYVCASVVGIVFGTIHLIGWNLPFLTTAERWLWRASSLILIAVPAIIVLSRPLRIPLWVPMTREDDLFVFVLWFLVIRVGSPLYVIARFAVLILAFLALRQLPESAFRNVEWSNFIPHI